MGRKNRSTRQQVRVLYPKNFHLMWSTDELYQEPTLVRYMGEHDGYGWLTCWHPEGFEVQCHVSHVWRPRSAREMGIEVAA